MFVPPVSTRSSSERATKERGTYTQEIAANDDGNESSLSSESLGCSDTQSNCSEESFEVVLGKQGAEDEASDEVVAVAEEKEDNKGCCPQQMGRPVNRRVKGLDDRCQEATG
jgi:hypothetical protein